MKKLFITVALIAATAISVAIVSCKKDNENALKNPKQSEAAALLNRIEAFQAIRDAVNSGAKADGSMTVEEMRQILDLMSNYEHSEHMTYCLNTVLDTLHVAMPAVDGEGYVNNVDVVATYNAFETALEKCLLGVNDERNVPSYFSIVMPKIGAKDVDDIDIVFTRGEADDEIDTVSGPFGEEHNYKWGMLLGHCPFDPTSRITDAAKELSRKLKYTIDPQHAGMTYFLTNVEYAKYTPLEDAIHLSDYTYYDGIIVDNCSSTWLYVQGGDFEEEPCIYYDELNCYYANICATVVNPNAPLYFSRNHVPYHECKVVAKPLYFPPYVGAKRPHRVHVLDPIIYGYKVWIAQNQYDE